MYRGPRLPHRLRAQGQFPTFGFGRLSESFAVIGRVSGNRTIHPFERLPSKDGSISRVWHHPGRAKKPYFWADSGHSLPSGQSMPSQWATPALSGPGEPGVHCDRPFMSVPRTKRIRVRNPVLGNQGQTCEPTLRHHAQRADQISIWCHIGPEAAQRTSHEPAFTYFLNLTPGVHVSAKLRRDTSPKFFRQMPVQGDRPRCFRPMSAPFAMNRT